MNELQLLTGLGSRIREIRLKKGITQNELANRCNFEKASMSRIESGRSNLTFRTMHKICKALDIHITELFSPLNT
jgi:transcriptional regulator with XRE-family HTH domain